MSEEKAEFRRWLAWMANETIAGSFEYGNGVSAVADMKATIDHYAALERALDAADALLDCIPDFTDGRNDDVVDEYERLRAATLPAAIKESER